MIVLRWIGRLAGSLLLLCAAPAAGEAARSAEYTAGEAAFAVRFGDRVVAHRVMAVTVLPNVPVRLAVEAGAAEGYRIEAEAPDDALLPISDRQWRFSAPDEPGLYPVTVTDTAAQESVRLQVFVLRPWDHEGRRLNGYRLGHYRQRALRGRERYEAPAGFIEVTAENKDVRVAPNFRLEQFLCKQTDATPQYALVRTRLLQRLERLLAAVNARGHSVPTLHVMSGYRTPYYNRAIGNTTTYSRHLYGDAADVFVDVDGDRWMDDLTGDGRATVADARYLARLVRATPTPGDERFNGGLGVYESASHRGPFIHVDLRGFRARW
jgi:hypothetical protein